MVSAITFRRRLPADVTIDQIVLEIEVSENVADDGLVILADPGFAPDRDGCTLRSERRGYGSVFRCGQLPRVAGLTTPSTASFSDAAFGGANSVAVPPAYRRFCCFAHLMCGRL